ncbi:DNA/RNA non-specific endonuclease [Hyphococcus flavus]|uniref:DNA/RNA non-specific endonuclease n=1 Tax=Hyphococcus flavus TaxID=1866326 RepID=A0AAE9ZGI2_9PROT|nr:DNA/RNA non-specific endonuclease [Hyphococcus flavus]WDI32342.1 DNA/RNA non-specific endonuclease [Hyphococcus flavus]
MLTSPRSLLILISIFLAAPANAQPFDVGDEVILRSDNPRGVPIHRLPRSSLVGFAEQGASAVIEDTAREGRWLRVTMDDAQAWVLASNAFTSDMEIPNERPSDTDRTLLLDAPCEETGPRERLTHPLFVVCFDTSWRIPLWVAYRLSPNAMSGPGDRKKSSWEQDTRIAPLLQAFDREYVGSGWHRGHMAPAEAFTRTQPAVDFTHQFSNAVPQSGSVNSGAWSKLEKHVRGFVEDGATVWIFTGSLSLDLKKECLEPPFDSSCRCLSAAGDRVEPERRMDIRQRRIAVPSHTFKTFLVEQDGEWDGFAFVMTNIHRPMGSFFDYQYSIDRVEGLLGLDLYASLDAATEETVEANTISISSKRRRNRCP